MLSFFEICRLKAESLKKSRKKQIYISTGPLRRSERLLGKDLPTMSEYGDEDDMLPEGECFVKDDGDYNPDDDDDPEDDDEQIAHEVVPPGPPARSHQVLFHQVHCLFSLSYMAVGTSRTFQGPVLIRCVFYATFVAEANRRSKYKSRLL